MDTADSGSNSFAHLFRELRIGPLTSRNRIVFGAHFTMFSEPSRRWGEPGFHGARLGRYVEERARGGAGVIIVGQTQVHPTTAYQMNNNAIGWDEEAIPHFRDVSQPIRRHGALPFLQLAHNGGVNFGTWSKLPVWAPSHVVNSTEAPQPLEPSDIQAVIDGFARSAANAVAGGFVGIEVHAAHGYLIHEFLSPRSNQRTDHYGGTLENRMRFLVEVLRAVRAATGSDIAVGVRLVGDEELANQAGLTPDDAATIAARLEHLGLVDFVNVSVGVSGIGMVRPLYAPRCLGATATRVVKQAMNNVPVFAVHRIVTPDEANSLIERGDADAVTLVRALIADPEWPNKTHSGAADSIRLCTGCNQGCYGNLTQSLPITCVTNPVVGREDSLGFGTLSPAPKRKHVLVIGGGPAGLEAAWVAAARGHRVVLLERDSQLGGKINLARQLPGREELGNFTDWRAAECRRQGVEIRLNSVADVDAVLALQPDAVIVASGGRATKFGTSKMFPMPVRGSEQDFVVDHEYALRHLDALGERILIFDVVGHIEAIGLGEALVRLGKQATVVTPLPTPMSLDRETIGYALPRAAQAGVEWTPNTGIAQIGDHSVSLIDVLSRRIETRDAIDTVVIRTHGLPNDDLYFSLQSKVPEVIRVGDAVAVRYADRAIYDGHLAGRRV